MPLRDSEDIHNDCKKAAKAVANGILPAPLEDALKTYLGAITARLKFIATPTTESMTSTAEMRLGVALDKNVANAEREITMALGNPSVKSKFRNRMDGQNAIDAYKKQMAKEPGYERMNQTYRTAG